jgi:type VI secretion system protein ImpA
MTIDIDALLAPVSDASPCGEDLMFSAAFDEIQEARRADDQSLDQGEWIKDVKEADWRFVAEQCALLLRTQSKDLRLAVWLTEALAHRAGMAGLTQGYVLMRELCERYWSGLHPLPDGDEGLDYRISPLEWMISRSVDLLNGMALTDAARGMFSALDWHQAHRRGTEHEDAHVSIEQIEAARAATASSFYEGLLHRLQEFAAALHAFETLLRERAGDAAPGFAPVRDAFDEVRLLAERFARERGVTATSGANEASVLSDARSEQAVSSAKPVQSMTIAVSERAQAIAQLKSIAEYFRRTEPHSPVAFLAEKAVRWADMPLDQWLANVIKDESSLAHLRELLGLMPPGDQA